MYDQNCIFCKIAAGEIPSKTIYEDETFRVILDLGAATRGHSLILPKNHYADLHELPDEIAGEAMKLAKKLIKQMTEALQCAGFNILQNNGEAAGQTVFHYHLHLIPRYAETENILVWEPGKPSIEELEKTKNEIIGIGRN